MSLYVLEPPLILYIVFYVFVEVSGLESVDTDLHTQNRSSDA
jgi:hypothetical protein